MENVRGRVKADEGKMKIRKSKIVWVFCILSFTVALGLTSACKEAPKKPTAAPAVHKKNPPSPGEMIYREGILPSGEHLSVAVKGTGSVPGTVFSCASCHRRSGFGSTEEGIYTPPANGPSLFKPRGSLYRRTNEYQKYLALPPPRPAYTDATLSNLMRTGKDPTGRVLSSIMPRYIIDDNDMAILINYLRSLSARFSPGVTDSTIRFATVITDDVDKKDRAAMADTLEYYFKLNKDQVNATIGRQGADTKRMAEIMLGSSELATKKILLSQWLLTGSPDTWRDQLEEYNRTEPVFALLGGITNGDWRPIHEFSEDNGIPTLFPITNFPVVSDKDWYTLYLSKGYYQEGEGVARYLNGKHEEIGDRNIVEIVRATKEGNALADGFQRTWKEFGLKDPIIVTLQVGEKLKRQMLEQILAKEKPIALIVWDGEKTLAALKVLKDTANRPAMTFVSSGYLGNDIWDIEDDLRDLVFISYPYSFSPYKPTTVMTGTAQVRDDTQNTLKETDVPLADKEQRIKSLSKSLTDIFTTALMDMRGNYYRDHLFDVLDVMMDQQYPLYGRISFGPGQRYASKGCFIVQLMKGKDPVLIKKSDWLTY